MMMTLISLFTIFSISAKAETFEYEGQIALDRARTIAPIDNRILYLRRVPIKLVLTTPDTLTLGEVTTRTNFDSDSFDDPCSSRHKSTSSSAPIKEDGEIIFLSESIENSGKNDVNGISFPVFTLNQSRESFDANDTGLKAELPASISAKTTGYAFDIDLNEQCGKREITVEVESITVTANTKIAGDLKTAKVTSRPSVRIQYRAYRKGETNLKDPIELVVGSTYLQ